MQDELKVSGKTLHEAFQVGIVLKGLIACAEIVGGAVLIFFTTARVDLIVNYLTADELAENPGSFFANLVQRAGESYTAGSQHFLIFYFLSHGLVKLFLIIALWKEKAWAFPASLAIFSLFVVYQTYRFLHTHSPLLLLVTVFDLVVIYLVFREYRRRFPKISAL
jgi:uncharacterized membrane protein